MPETVFPFPGGKTRHANWILDHLPDHTCYVEVFGGAGAVLVNKEPSKVEVYNDADEDLVHFFDVLRERPDELTSWLDAVPYARTLHTEWCERFYNGYRPSDPVARAGQFFYLRYAQFGAGYDAPNGFATSKVTSRAASFQNKLERLDEFSQRFAHVVIENLDWADVLEKYDGPETVFYLDPPYVDQEDYYRVQTVDHAELVDTLPELEGEWVCSYSDLPEGMEEFTVVSKDDRHFMGNGVTGATKQTCERLVLSSESLSG